MGSLIHRMVHLHGKLSPRTLSIPWPLVGIRPHVTEALDGRYFRPTTGRNHLITTRESSLTLRRYTYKNAVSNGGFFQMAARLARFTGNNTYYEWAERVWDWTTGVGFIDESYRIFDGASTTDNCSEISQLQWTYNPGLFIYGSAMLYNYTNGSSVWETRLTGLVEQVNQTFFQAFDNATNVMVEAACEPYGTCNNDQYSFKAYLARFLAKTMVVAPYTRTTIQPLLVDSAQAAARSCSGPSDGVTCGEKWYTEFDGKYGIGQELSALEVTQALLIDDAPAIMNHNNVKIKPATTTSTLAPTVSVGPASVSGITSTSATTTAKPTTTHNAAIKVGGSAPLGALVGGAMLGAAALL